MAELKNTNSHLFEIFKKNIKVFLIVGVVGIIVSAVFSSSTFIPPKFKSTAVVYPSNLKEYSDESSIEQMIQWFESVEIKNRVIDEKQLIEHYKLDTNDKLFYYDLMTMYDENVSISETRYETALIKVVDENPEMAFEIVNSIITNFNEVVREVKLKRTNEQLKNIKYRFGLIVEQLDSLGYKNHLPFEEGESYITHGDRVTSLMEEYTAVSEDYHYLLAIINEDVTYTNLVVKPYISQKKVYPIRWLIVVFSTFFSVLFTFIIILLKQKIK